MSQFAASVGSKPITASRNRGKYKNYMRKIIDEFTARDDLSAWWKWRLRHPEVPRHKESPETSKRYREQNRERITNYLSEYAKRPEVREFRKLSYRRRIADLILYAARSRAKKKNLDFNIDKSDIIIPEMCPITLLPLYVNNGKSGPNSPTLDRVHNHLGYTKGNVEVISKKANTHKGNMSFEEIERMYNYMKKERLLF